MQPEARRRPCYAGDVTLARVVAQIEVEVPGRWTARDDDLLRRIQAVVPDAELRWEGPSTEVAEVFAAAAAHLRASEQEVEAVRLHHSRVVAKVAVHRGEVRSAQRLLQGLRPLVSRPQALGVHVRSVGKAHAVREWSEYEPRQPFDLLRAFVLWGAGGDYRTWGMKNLGLPDVVVRGQPWPQAATAVMQAFAVERVERPQTDPPPDFELAGQLHRVQWAMAKPDDNPFGHHVLTTA